MKLGKKVLSLLAVLALLGTLLSVIPVIGAGAAGENLVVNGDFETGDMTGWTAVVPSGENFMVWESEQYAHSGTHELVRYGANSWSSTYVYQTVAVEPGKTYTFSAWFKTAAGFGGTTYIDVVNGDSGAAAWSAARDTGKSESYKEVTFEITPTGENVTIIFGLRGGGIAQASLFIDDVSLIEKTATPDGGEEIPFTGIVNGDFETGDMTGWTAVVPSGENFTVWDSEQYAHSGTHELVRFGANSWSTTYVYQTVAVEPGKTYTFSAWYKTAASFGGAVYIGLVDGADAAAAWSGKQSYSASASYTEVTYDFVPTGSSVTIAFGLGGGNISQASLFIDDVSLVVKENAPAKVGTQLHSKGDALRFKFNLNVAGLTMDEETHACDLSEATIYADGVECAVTDFGVVLSRKADATEDDLTVGTDAATTSVVPAAKLTSLEGNKATFVARINVPEDKRASVVTARAYVAYEVDGVTQYMYSDSTAYSIESLLEALEELENQ